MSPHIAQPTLLTLPTELRLQILSYLVPPEPNLGFHAYKFPLPASEGLYIDDCYSAATYLQFLLTCRQFRNDFTQLAYRRTNFIIRDTYTPAREKLGTLSPLRLDALRRVSFVVAGQMQFRDILAWGKYPFDMETVHLDTLSIVFHRSGYMHYPHDFTHSLVALLRRLQNVRKLRFIRNGANIKGCFRTWFNRLVGLILKEDHHQRYDFPGAPHLPACWWEWRFDEGGQSFELVAREPIGVLEEQEYMEMVKPWIEQLMREMENEDLDPDPRARGGF